MTTREADGRGAGAPTTRAWGYHAAGKRDLRLDLLRGYAVFGMVVYHLSGPSWLYLLAGPNLLVSHAEGFVFIAGLLVGQVYGARARAAGLGTATRQLLARAWTLYVLAVGLTLGGTLLGHLGRLPWASARATEAPLPFVFEVLLLRRTIPFVDVLVLYIFLMLLAPPALALLQRGRWRPLALASWGVWGAAQLVPTVRLLPWPIAGGAAFPLASWQVLFVAGLLLGHERARLARWGGRWPPLARLRPAAWGAPLTLGLAGLLWGGQLWLHGTGARPLDRLAPGGHMAPLLAAWFDKPTLAPPRLVACAAFAAVAWALATHCWRPLRAASGWFLLPLGQRALYAFAAHIVVLTVAYLGARQVWGAPGPGKGGNTLLQVGALLALWQLTRARALQRWLAPLGRPPWQRGSAPGATSGPAAATRARAGAVWRAGATLARAPRRRHGGRERRQRLPAPPRGAGRAP